MRDPTLEWASTQTALIKHILIVVPAENANRLDSMRQEMACHSYSFLVPSLVVVVVVAATVRRHC